MIPEHLQRKAFNAVVGDHNHPSRHQAAVYRVLIRRTLEAVAADIWDEGLSAGVANSCGDVYAFEPNPYRASETA